MNPISADLAGNAAPAPRRGGLRLLLALLSTIGGLALVAATLWVQDWRYSLPTPRPSGLVQPAVGTELPPAELARLGLVPAGRPLFLHFTSPDCPCSRFVVDHVRALVLRHGTQLGFVVVREGEDDSRPLDLGVPERADPTGELASALGVYSTPQAVILAADGTLWFRGNYNLSRFCVRRDTEFARMALEALLAGEPPPAWPEQATLAYGCALPAQVEE